MKLGGVDCVEIDDYRPLRKEFLRKELGLKIWYAGDAPLALHTFKDRGYQTICAFNLGLDPLDRLELAGLPRTAKLEKLSPRGTWKDVVREKEIVSEEFIVLEGNDGYPLLERYAELWAEAMHARKWDHIPTGWCSWYYYFSKITEQDVQENLEYLKAHKAEYPLEPHTSMLFEAE